MAVSPVAIVAPPVATATIPRAAPPSSGAATAENSHGAHPLTIMEHTHNHQ